MPLNKRIHLMRQRFNSRKPSSYPTDGTGIPLRITRLFPMKLKDFTVEKLKQGRQESNVVCLNEMMTLFACFESNEFNRKPCEKHVEALERCYSDYLARRKESKSSSMAK